MTKLKTLIFALLTFVSFGRCSEKEPVQDIKEKSTFTNPVWDGADPWMVKHNNEYVYCWSANNSINISRSAKMTQKGELKKIWQAPSTGWNRACVWAPEIHFIQGRWYVYYAAGESGPPFIHQRTGVLRSATEDVFSDYEDMGVLYTGDNPSDPASNVWAIDMTTLEHKGKLYCIWSGWIKQETTDATVLIIAQRVTTVMDADRIIVLEDGQMAGMGTHKELLNACQVYREIVYSQLSEEELA